jgi:hypothetical protein
MIDSTAPNYRATLDAGSAFCSIGSIHVMKIPTGLFPFLTFICLGAVVFLGPHIFVKSAGPEADHRRKLIRIGSALYVVLMVIFATAFLLAQN